MKLPHFAHLAETHIALVAGVLFCSLSPCLDAATGDRGFPIVATYTSSEVGADMIGLAAIQAPNGIVYVGSHSLLAFDGDRWRSFPVAGSYGLRGLDFGSDGRIWAGAIGEIGWFAESQGGWTYNSLREKIPNGNAPLGELHQVIATPEGAVFISDTQIIRWDGIRMEIWTLPGARRLRAERIAGKIFVQHAPTGIYELTEKGPILTVSTASLGNVGICFWMDRTADGWTVLTGRGLLRYSAGKWETLGDELAKYLAAYPPTSAIRMRDQRIAVGTVNNGLVVIRPDGVTDLILEKSRGFPTRYVVPLLEDRDGGLWVAGTVSLSRISINPASTVFDSRARFPLQPITKIVRYRDKIVFATNQGFYDLDPASREFVPNDWIPDGSRDLQLTPQGLLVAGLHGVTLLSAGGATKIYDTIGEVFRLTRSNQYPNISYIADHRRILELTDAGVSRLLVHELPDYPNSIAEDTTGRLWIGTKSQGLFLATVGESPVNAGRPSAELGYAGSPGETRVTSLPDGTVLIFNSAGGWLLPPAGRKLHRITNHPPRTVSATTADPRDPALLWVVHPADDRFPPAVARITVRGSEATWQPHSVDNISSVGSPRSILVEAENDRMSVIWLGGTAAVIRHEFNGKPAVETPGVPLLRSIARADGTGEPFLIGKTLPSSTRSLTFEFALPEFSRRSSLRLETRIDPVDPDWIPASADSRRELTAVRDGHYRFQVRAVTAAGQPGPSAALEFDVLPPWWRTKGFIGTAVMAMLPLGYGLYRLRVRALRQRNAQLEAKVRQRTEELVQANAAKTRFVSNISHDIRNPLNGIVGLTLALEDTPLEEHQKQIVSTLRECTTYLSTLVDDVLDFASIEAGRVELRPARFAPERLLESVVQTLKSDTAASGATLVINLAPNLPPNLVGDAGRIQQILVNFVSNALKYAGGTIHLSAAIPADSSGEVEFAVRDEGPGISAAEQAILFTRFSRLRQRTGGEEVPGTGLGLASCRLLADLMGGSVAVESKTGAGARFVIRLPLEIAGPPADAPEAPVPNSSVLVVEDADYNAWAATAVLARLGLTGERARTGTEAVEMFRRKRYNVVLLDRNLPDLDGTEVARQIRELETDGARAIIFAVTAYCTPEDRSVCLAAGMDAFVGKPLTPEKLRKVLTSAGQGPLAAASIQAPDEIVTAPYDLRLITFLSDGSTSGMEKQIRVFISALEETAAHLRTSLAIRDFAQLGHEAHRLHGQAKMVEGRVLAEAAVQLETAARTGDESACRDRLGAVSREIQLLTEAIRLHVPAARSD